MPLWLFRSDIHITKLDLSVYQSKNNYCSLLLSILLFILQSVLSFTNVVVKFENLQS